MEELYKESEEVDKVKDKIVTKNTDNCIETEKAAFDEFDKNLEKLASCISTGNVEVFRSVVEEMNAIFLSPITKIFEHALTTSFIANTVGYILESEDDFVAPILRLLAGFCNAPDYSTSSALLRYEGFSERISQFLNSTEDGNIFIAAVILAGNIYYDCTKGGFEFNIDFSTDVMARVSDDFSRMEEEVLQTYAIMLDGSMDAMMRNNLLIYSTELISHGLRIKLGTILDAFRCAIKADTECIDILESNDFLYENLLRIITPDALITSRSTKEEKAMLYSNSINGLMLVKTIIKKGREKGSSIVSCINWEGVLKNIKEKPDRYTAKVFRLLTVALPTRHWLLDIVKSNEVINLLPNMLADSGFNVRFEALKFVNTLMTYGTYSANLEIFDDLICSEFVDVLTNLLETTDWKLFFEVVNTINNFIEVAMRMERNSLIAQFKCEEVGDIFDDFETSDSVPDNIKGKISSLIFKIKFNVDAIVALEE